MACSSYKIASLSNYLHKVPKSLLVSELLILWKCSLMALYELFNYVGKYLIHFETVQMIKFNIHKAVIYSFIYSLY